MSMIQMKDNAGIRDIIDMMIQKLEPEQKVTLTFQGGSAAGEIVSRLSDFLVLKNSNNNQSIISGRHAGKRRVSHTYVLIHSITSISADDYE